MIAATGVLLALTASGAPRVLHVRANAAFSACLAPAVQAFNRTSPIPAVLVTGEPDPPLDADLVVGDDVEMTRLLEGGRADLAGAADLGYLPWVAVVPAGADASALAASAGPISVLGGAAGREARESLRAVAPQRLRVEREGEALRHAAYALVPRSLAGPGEHRLANVRALVATAAVPAGAPHGPDARRLLAFLQGPDGARALRGCLDPAPPGAAATATAGAAEYAQSIVDWWLPQCTLDRNGYKDPQEVLGRPDAVNLGSKDNYRGIMSMGQGGYVTVDMGMNAVDGPGADIRVFQTTTGEPVTLYASASASGPFVLVGLRIPCGIRSPGLVSNHCDFDLAGTGLASARFLKIEDGEVFPCLAGDTITEGTDIDAVQILNPQ
jgi:hypothetical protein